MDHIEHSTGHEWAFKSDVAYDFDDDDLFLQKITVGARAAKRDETVRSTACNWGVLSEVWSGSGGPVWLTQGGGDQAAFYSFDNFFRGQTPGPVGGYYYSGNLIQGYNQFGQFATNIHDIWNSEDNANNSSGWVPAADRAGVIPGTPFLPSEIQKVTQRNENLYVMLNFGNNNPIFGGIRLNGNIGVRYVGMRTTSLGNIGVPTAAQAGVDENYDVRCAAQQDENGNPIPPSGVCKLTPAQYANLQTFANGATTPNLAVTNYHYFLPSLNLKFGLTRDLIFRLAASRVLTQPSLGDIRNFLQTSYDADSGQLSATAGNPYLKPATADQFDATIEWYFARVGSLTVDAFYKNVKNFFYSEVMPRTITNNGVTDTIYVRGPANYSGSGKIKGVEVAYQQTFDFLPGFLSGLGVNANYTYLNSKGLPNSFLNNGAPVTASTIPTGRLPLEQLSKHNVNVQLFYEKGPVSLRAAYNWRSKFLLTDADVIYPYYPIFNAATGQLDASAFYSLSKNIKIGVQAVNLTDEVTKTEQMFTTNGLMGPRSYFMNDRRYSFIMRANF